MIKSEKKITKKKWCQLVLAYITYDPGIWLEAPNLENPSSLIFNKLNVKR